MALPSQPGYSNIDFVAQCCNSWNFVATGVKAEICMSKGDDSYVGESDPLAVHGLSFPDSLEKYG